MYTQTDWHIGKILARCTTRGLGEHFLKIEFKLFSGLGGDSLTSFHSENKMNGRTILIGVTEVNRFMVI